MELKTCPNCGYKTASPIVVGCPECGTKLILNTPTPNATTAKPQNKVQTPEPKEPAQNNVILLPKLPEAPYNSYTSETLGLISLIVAAIFLLCAFFSKGSLNGIAACAFGILGTGLYCFSAIHKMREQNNFYQDEILKAILYSEKFRQYISQKNENIIHKVPQIKLSPKELAEKTKKEREKEDRNELLLILGILVASFLLFRLLGINIFK
ncbi:hypothetical protein [Candidatus Avelusimicrobium stercoris]|uniref:hypothetical protein n=1 Tax=Candidatus Avelusimicrobium stercoris TaxID=1947924 RepID=UPI003D126C2A